MKKITKVFSVFLAAVCLTLCLTGNIATVSAAPKDSYKPFPLTADNMLYPMHYYDNAEMTGEPIKHTFIKIASGWPHFGCDNNRGSGLTSKPYKFSELYDTYVANGSNGNVVIPCCVLDLAVGGEPVEIAAFGLSLRSHFDCEPLHIMIQVTTEANSSNWVTVYEEKDILWNNISMRWTFDPVKAYMVRIVVLDLDEVDIEAEGDYYDAILGNETRFAYSEVDVYILENDDEPTDPTESPTQKPTDPTQAPTEKPTDPTEVPTDSTEATTPKPTEPTASPTEPTASPTVPTAEPTASPTEPTEEPSDVPTDPTEDTAQNPVDPTEEPTTTPSSAPTDDPTEAHDETLTQAPTDAPKAKNDTAQPKSHTGLIIGIVAAVVLVAVGVVLFVKKKR